VKDKNKSAKYWFTALIFLMSLSPALVVELAIKPVLDEVLVENANTLDNLPAGDGEKVIKLRRAFESNVEFNSSLVIEMLLLSRIFYIATMFFAALAAIYHFRYRSIKECK
jgi:hypothetical protein